jgi:hypothetical protein
MPVLLVLAASPIDQDRLRLNNELKQIKRSLQRSRNRENWTIEINEAATVDDLRQSLLDFRPTIVHFSGHGDSHGSLAFETDEGFTNAANAQPLTRLLHQFKDSLKCVVLNACYSEVQGAAIRQQIDYVVGMSRTIDDDSATKFATAFYDAVFAGTTFRQAFDIGCTAIDLSNLPGPEVPVLLTGPALGSETLSYTALIPQFEDFILAYINAPFEWRYTFTTKGEALRETMNRSYAESLQTIAEKATVISTRQIDDLHWKVRTLIQLKGLSQRCDYYLRVEDRQIQVDWEATTGYWSMPVKTYLALGTSEPIVARVHASLGTNYFGEFSEKARLYQSVHLSTRCNQTLHGFVSRHAPHGKQLIELLSDGNQHDLTVSIANASMDTDHPVIVDLLSHTWLYGNA